MIKALLVVLLVLLAGCVQDNADSVDPSKEGGDLEPTADDGKVQPIKLSYSKDNGSKAPYLSFVDVPVTTECGGTLVLVVAWGRSCAEPTVAVHPSGLWFYSTANGDVLARSEDGENWTLLDAPPRPVGTGEIVGDAHILFDDDGRLWWSALSMNTNNVIVARSDDLGETWPLVRGIGYAPVDQSPAGADRQWLGFAPDGRILMLCNCPALTVPMLAWSEDDGETWTVMQAPDLVSHQGPPGPPLFLEDGTLLIPHLTGGPTNGVTDDGIRVAVGIQRDDGGFDIVSITENEDPLVCCAWPNLAVDDTGAIWATWAAETGPAVAQSMDGRDWSDWVEVKGPGDIVYPHPGIEPFSDGMVLSWFDETARGHVVTWIDDQGNVTHTRIGDAPSPASDYNDIAVGPDGTIVVPWTGEDSGWVSVGRL